TAYPRAAPHNVPAVLPACCWRWPRRYAAAALRPAGSRLGHCPDDWRHAPPRQRLGVYALVPQRVQHWPEHPWRPPGLRLWHWRILPSAASAVSSLSRETPVSDAPGPASGSLSPQDDPLGGPAPYGEGQWVHRRSPQVYYAGSGPSLSVHRPVPR